MKLTLKSLFPSSLFKKITLKAAILVGLVLFYLVIIFSNSREGIETTAPSVEIPQTMDDVKKMLDTETKKMAVPKETESAPTSVETTPPATPLATPPATPPATPLASPPATPLATPPAPTVETLVSASSTSYSTY